MNSKRKPQRTISTKFTYGKLPQESSVFTMKPRLKKRYTNRRRKSFSRLVNSIDLIRKEVYHEEVKPI